MIEPLAEAGRCSKQPHEIRSLRQFSARIGSDPSLVQASTGNTSIKVDGNLWIKASGKWLADARNDRIFVRVSLAQVRDLLARGQEMPDAADCATGKTLQPSIETPMHAVLPHRVVIHVHSVSAIAWAVRRDGQFRLVELLAGLHWTWIPYVDSGTALAQEIQEAMSRSPDANVFVLANHGLVVCGSDCSAAGRLLSEVEERLAATPRSYPAPNLAELRSLAKSSAWELPDDCVLHALGTDPISRGILDGGVLFPCQHTFFPARLRRFVIVERCGVLVARDISPAERAMLSGLAVILLRVAEKAQIRYLTESELRRVSMTSSGHYRERSAKTISGSPYV
jgi:rhamnose utilization protein RhaD (predicted bifunctional aldolase and dehydrogenase)